jgi:hypothetical protein
VIEFERAAHDHDVEAAIACFAPDIVVRSPITRRIQFSGIDQVSDLFRRLFDVVHDVRFYETVGEGQATQVIFWRGRVGRHHLEEANLLQLDDRGRIREMTVFMRPVPGLLALAHGLASSPAGRNRRLRRLAARIVLGSISILYRAGEPLLVTLAGAGVPVPDP